MKSYSQFRQERLSNQTRCVDELERCLKASDSRQELNVFLQRNDEQARRDAMESDRRFDEGNARALEGMIVAVKDNISVQGLSLTCSSKILENFKPVYDATVIQRLKDAGAIVIGKTNCDEFAMGSSNENSAYGPVGHPINPEFVPGGSSGGSAAAVAAGMAHCSLGSDTGGSIRQPAAFCGVYGLKPSYGRISRYGLVAFASSLDQIGPMSASLDDVAMILDVVSGKDDRDATSAQMEATSSVRALAHHDDETTIGIFPDSLLEGCSSSVLDRYKHCLEVIRSMGMKTVEVQLAGKEAWIPTYYILATAEASANLARFDGVRYGYRSKSDEENMMAVTRSEGFGAEVKRRIMLGTFVLSSGYYDAYYKKGQQARRLVFDGYQTIFSQCDALFLPTTPTPAFRRGEKSSNPIEMYLNDLFTVSANLAGIPAISFPAGNDADGFPIGMQLQCAMNEDERLLRLTKRIADACL